MSGETEEKTAGWDDPRWTRAGITYRQIDYWTRSGHIHAVEDTPGYGVPRRWPVAEMDVAIRTRRLLDVGFSLAAALEVARLGLGRHELADGIVLRIARRPR